MKEVDVELPERESEHDRVVGWRFEVLLGSGFPLVEAEMIAESQVDLHRAADLVRRGCPPALAARILL